MTTRQTSLSVLGLPGPAAPGLAAAGHAGVPAAGAEGTAGD